MKKKKLHFLKGLILLLCSFTTTAQSVSGNATEATVRDLQVDSTKVEIEGDSFVLDEKNTTNLSKVLVDHSIIYEAIQTTKGHRFFVYKRIEKIVYLLPNPTRQIKMRLEESMAEN